MSAILLTATAGVLVDAPTTVPARSRVTSYFGVAEPYGACPNDACSSKPHNDSSDAATVPTDERARGFSRTLQEKAARHSDCNKTSESDRDSLRLKKQSSGVAATAGPNPENSVSGQEPGAVTMVPATPEGEGIDGPCVEQGGPRVLCQAAKQAFLHGSHGSKRGLRNIAGRDAADAELQEVKSGRGAVGPDLEILACQGCLQKQVNEASTGGNQTCQPGKRQMTATAIASHAPKAHGSLPAKQLESLNNDNSVGYGPKKSVLLAKESADNEFAPSQMLLKSAGEKEGNGDLTANATAWKLNAEGLRMFLSQTKGSHISASDESSTPDFEQAVSLDARIPASVQVSASMEMAKTAAGAWPSDASASIGQQITESVHASLRQGDKQVAIQLDPPELGKILVKFEEQEGQITGSLEISKAEIRYEIEQALPQIIRTLGNCGVQLKRLEVLLADHSEQEAGKDQLPQNGPFQQRDFAEGDDPGSKSTYEWLASSFDGSYLDVPGQQVIVTGDSINILL